MTSALADARTPSIGGIDAAASIPAGRGSTSRTVLYALLLVVAAAAAVLSFAALRDLALLCGFDARLAWLLPVVIDAGAGAGSLVWLGGAVGDSARRFARALALGLLGLSVAANALGHGLAAFGLAPAWWVVVIVSATAPAVLGAVVHLAVLVGRPLSVSGAVETDEPIDYQPIGYQLTAAAYLAGTVDEHGVSRSWDTAPPAAAAGESGSVGQRAAALIAAGAGRRRLARELDITEYEARRLLAEAHTTTPNAATHSPFPAPDASLFDARLGAALLNGVRS